MVISLMPPEWNRLSEGYPLSVDHAIVGRWSSTSEPHGSISEFDHEGVGVAEDPAERLLWCLFYCHTAFIMTFSHHRHSSENVTHLIELVMIEANDFCILRVKLPE